MATSATCYEILSSRCSLELGECDLVAVIHEVVKRLDTWQDSTEKLIPNTSLLSVVTGLLPATRVMVVVVLNDEVHIEHLHGQQVECGWRTGASDTRVANELNEDDVGPAEQPVVVAEIDDGLNGEVSEEGDEEDVEPFLLGVGEKGEDGSWVLGGVVRAVELPEQVGLVHDSVVDVEPEVGSDREERHDERQPWREGDWRIAVVDDQSGGSGSEECGHEERIEHRRNLNVRNTISCGVRLEVTDLGNGLPENVEEIRAEERDVNAPVDDVDDGVERASSPLSVGVLNTNGGQVSHQHPEVELSVTPNGNGVILRVLDCSGALWDGIDACEVDQPVVETPRLLLFGLVP